MWNTLKLKLDNLVGTDGIEAVQIKSVNLLIYRLLLQFQPVKSIRIFSAHCRQGGDSFDCNRSPDKHCVDKRYVSYFVVWSLLANFKTAAKKNPSLLKPQLTPLAHFAADETKNPEKWAHFSGFN